MSRWVLTDNSDYLIEIENHADYLIFHMPRCTRIRRQAMQAHLEELQQVAVELGRTVACAVSVDNEAVCRLVLLLGLTETHDFDLPTGKFRVFKL